jgi:NADH dehydrogenase [ubiquinone] 1 alpha subcomplex assembly factor 7
VSALKEKILRRIASEGPITLAQYMQMALYDPQYGYYMKGDPFGVKGDFITAPEVSQIFGELIGLWFVQAWEDRGRPKRFHFVELGPGRGTLMADMLRAAKVRPAFLEAAHVSLVETSPALREIQQRTLQLEMLPIAWTTRLDKITGSAPLFLVANEFLDALPITQYVKTDHGWCERLVAADGKKLVFTLSAKAETDFPIPSLSGNAPSDSIFEFSAAAQEVIGAVAKRIAQSDGAALFLDYGHERSDIGDTFQAVKAHHFTDALTGPGDADLTAHVDFEALVQIAIAAKAKVFGPLSQAVFLDALGVRVRAEMLKRKADAATRTDISSAVERLINRDQMGTLFKVMALAQSSSPALPGFPC